MKKEKIVTFNCMPNVYVYTEKSKVIPRFPYNVHESISDAFVFLIKKGKTDIKVIEE